MAQVSEPSQFVRQQSDMEATQRHAAVAIAALSFAASCVPAMTLQDFYKPAGEPGSNVLAKGYGWTQSQGSDGVYTLKFRVPNSGMTGSLSDLWDRRATEICGNGQYKKTIYKAERALAYDSYNMVTVAGDFIYEGFLECGVTPTKS
jgi:hypothetical protein